MKTKPTLYIAILLVFLFESIVAVLVYNKIGSGRVAVSTIRLLIQIIFLLVLIKSNNKVILYLFTFYHVIVCLQFLMKENSIINILFGIYHVIITILVYFNDYVDNKIFREKLQN